MRSHTAQLFYSNSSFDNVNSGLEWNNNMDGTYRHSVPGMGSEYRAIPKHDKIKEIYDFVFQYAMQGYGYGATFNECLKLVTEKFGEMSVEMIDYLKSCPYDAGDRAGMLRDDPSHYD